jgi:hypothetical protein
MGSLSQVTRAFLVSAHGSMLQLLWLCGVAPKGGSPLCPPVLLLLVCPPVLARLFVVKPIFGHHAAWQEEPQFTLVLSLTWSWNCGA